MAVLQVLFYSMNESFVKVEMEAVDLGGTMTVYTFGAYFGLGVSLMLCKPEIARRGDLGDNMQPSAHSDILSIMGTLFLFTFWPSFNAALASGIPNSQHRVIINTVLSLTGSALTTFSISRMLRGGKFNMEDIQRATLAGGIAIGSCASLTIAPVGALLLGLVAGLVSTLGNVHIS